MSTAFLGRVLFEPYFRLIIRHMSGVAFFTLAGLFWFAAPALAERAEVLEPGTGELRYELPGFSPAPPAPGPGKAEAEKTTPPDNEAVARPRAQSTDAYPPPGSHRSFEPVFAPSPRLTSTPSPTPAPVAEPTPKPVAVPEPEPVVTPAPQSTPKPVAVPAVTSTPETAPAPLASPAPQTPLKEHKSVSEPTKDMSYPLGSEQANIEKQGPTPLPVKAQGAAKPQGASAPLTSTSPPQPLKPEGTGGSAGSFSASTPPTGAVPWMRQGMGTSRRAPVARDLGTQEPSPVSTPPVAEQPAPESRISQEEYSGEESAGPEMPVQSYAADEGAQADIGYGAEDTSAPRARHDAGRQDTDALGATPPPVHAHARTPEERGRTAPRDERVPADLGPYAWVPASEAPPAESETEELPWELSADKVTAYNQNSVVDAEGEVLLQRGREYIKADFGRYFAETGWVYLKGNVEIYFGTDRLSGKEAEFDLANKVGWVKDGQVFMAGPHVYLSGERVNKNWGDTYTFRNAKVTTCDGDVPAWSLYAEDAVVELDGYARLWGSSLAIRNQKVAYSPYMILPAKRDRQSGFLVPRAGQDSRKGFYWDQSYYWAIDQNQDMTFNAYIMTDRGAMLGAEYRAKREWDENLWLRADYLHDSVTWDKRSDNYFDNGYLRTNSERYWLRGMYDGTPLADRNWKVKANVDYVSDAFFLREFKNDPAGYNTTRDYLEESFGRTLSPWSSNRVSEGVIYRDWDRITLSAGMRYEQNPYLGNGNLSRSSDIIAQKLPDINMYLHKGVIWEGLPLEAEGEGQMVYFYRREGVKGMRYDLNPKLSLPLRSDYGSLIPQVAVRGTAYQAGDEGRIEGDTGNNEDSSRAVPEFSLAGFTELARNYALDSAPLAVDEKSVGDRRWSGLRHTIQPRVDYVKRWKVNQDDLPYFDSVDRLAPRDEIVYSLTNLLTVKRESVALDKNNKPVLRDDYIDFVRFKLEAGYDFDEARRTWKQEAYKRRPFMDILADLTITPGNWFSVTSRTWWSPYDGDFTRMSNDISVWQQGIGRVRVGLDSRRRPDEYKRWSTDVLYRDLSLLHRGLIDEEDLRINRYRKPVDLLYTDVQLDYFTPFTFTFQQWYDLRGNDMQETHLSVLYTHQCFQLEAYMWWDQHDENYGFSVRLPGFWN